MILLFAFFAVDFATEVKPVIEKQCAACHDRAFFVRQKDKIVASLATMPPGGPLLNAKDRATLTKWVADGLPYPEAEKAMADDLALTKNLHSQIVKASEIGRASCRERVCSTV